jgi:multidrug transporter EmrE-like cation transporter
VGYLYILGTILFTVYGQLVIKWRVSLYGDLPSLFLEKIIFFARVFFDFWVLSGFIAGFIAGLFWISAMTKLDLSHAYPFMGLTFILIPIFSFLFFGENLSVYKMIGASFIMLGIIMSSQG